MNNFIQALTQPHHPPVAIMAEIKLQSPSSGVLGNAADLVSRAKAYEAADADIISCITEPKRFGGNPHFIPLLKKNVHLPIIQKDFVTTIQQIYQAQELGSDALLLIAGLVPLSTLKKLVNLCLRLDIEPVVEVFDAHNLHDAIKTKTRIIAVNARNLTTLTISVPQACQLLKKIPQPFIKLGFSGIKGPLEVTQYVKSGAVGVLVGTSLMQAPDIRGFISHLRSI